MAIQASTFTTHEAIGIREDLSDIIYDISPEETPFMSNCGRADMEQTYTEWQQDSLAAPVANAQIEGDDLSAETFDTVAPTVRLGNYAQISRKTLILSATEEIVNKAGRKSELSYQLAKKGAELKRDIESDSIGSNQAGAASGSDSVARTTAGMLAWLKTNVSFGAGGANPTYTSGAPTALRTDGTTRAFTESLLKTVMQLAWTAGGAPKTLMVDGVQKQTVSSFQGIATRTLAATEKVVTSTIGAVDVYVGDFGTYAIVPNRFQRHRDAWLLSFDYLQFAYLRNFMQVPLAKTGDAEKRMLICEWAVKVLHEGACGLVADLT